MTHTAQGCNIRSETSSSKRVDQAPDRLRRVNDNLSHVTLYFRSNTGYVAENSEIELIDIAHDALLRDSGGRDLFSSDAEAAQRSHR